MGEDTAPIPNTTATSDSTAFYHPNTLPGLARTKKGAGSRHEPAPRFRL